MQATSNISSIWKQAEVTSGYSTGVSLHSHTSMSEESLIFIQTMGMELPGVKKLYAHYSKHCLQHHGLTLDFESAHWRPPLMPRVAYDLEAKQIQELGLRAMVSISDHDNIEAPMLLRTVPEARTIPVSLEWSAPYGRTCFHMGIHNLPSADGRSWMDRFQALTAKPNDAETLAALRDLHAIPQVLIVFNHPMWDLYSIGREEHRVEMMRFIKEAGPSIHALELNGLRHARENREVRELASETGYLLISGGDRHGTEPNANINLTNATNFNDFVHEIRDERRSHVLFMQQYAQPWKLRILRSTLDAVSDFPEFTAGWQRWDERSFHKDAKGVMRPMSELWNDGKPPALLKLGVRVVRMARNATVARSIGMVFPGENDFRANYEVL
jgi:hypothetical protein